ncbi:QueT transporter family protein, partial [Lactobacillus reuteri]|nr:QueT transporter family protein [Limosilactobacillus reuteri]
MKNKLNPTQKLVLSAIIMALYIAILFISQAISFGAVQMRLATALYGLTYIFP